MFDPKPELSSIASALEELNSRISSLAERASHTEGADDIAHELFEVERAIAAGSRRLSGITSRRR